MFSTWFLILLSYFSSAIDGAGVVHGGFDANCKILNFDSHGEYDSTCSATLIAPSQVLTAAHCLSDSDNLLVQCGHLGFDLSFSYAGQDLTAYDSYLFGPQFRELHTVKSISIHPNYNAEDSTYDVAFLTLTTPSTLTPIEVWPYAKTFAGLNDFEECAINGFGINHTHSGNLYTAKIPVPAVSANHQGKIKFPSFTAKASEVPKSLTDAILENPTRKNMMAFIKAVIKTRRDTIPATTQPGDSGSALLCRHKTEGWKVIGVTKSVYLHRFIAKNEFTFTLFNDFIHPYTPAITPPEPPSEAPN